MQKNNSVAGGSAPGCSSGSGKIKIHDSRTVQKLKLTSETAGKALWIACSSENRGSQSVQVYTKDGDHLKEFSFSVAKGENNFRLDLSPLDPGVYIMESMQRVFLGPIERTYHIIEILE